MTGPVRFAVPFALVAALALPAAASASVRTTHSGWAWGDPTPQGQSLNAVEFAGQTGYATGDFGTLLKTTDGGRTWKGLATGLSEYLDVVRMIGSKTVIVGGTCALRRSDDGGTTFRRLPWTASDELCTGGIRAFDFPSSNVGVLILRDGNVLRSADGGRTWSRRTAIPGTAATSAASRVEPSDVDFVSDTAGFVTTSGGDIFRTADAGNTWKPVVAEPWSLRTITFPTAQTGYAAGDAPAVLKTTDGGATWSEIPLPADAGALARVRCADATTCVGVTTGGDRLVRTTDGGGDWESLAPSSLVLTSVGMPSATQAVGVGQNGTTVISGDAGNTFSPVGSALTGQFDGLRALDGKVAYAYGPFGSLARTTDGGRTWTENDAATSNTITGISFLSAKVGFVLDSTGQLLRTDNGGDSYAILNTGTAQVPEAVRALDAKRVLLVGPAGVRRSDDGGRTFRPNVQKAVRSAPLFDVERAGSTVLAYGPKNLLLSHDGGRHFAAMARPGSGRNRVRVDVVSLVGAKTALLLSAAGPLYRTDDAGRHWHELAGLGTEVGYAVRFSDASHGWVAVSEFGSARNAWVLRTSDGGRTWQPQLIAESAISSQGLAAVGPLGGYALSRDDQLFATTSGGAAGRVSTLSLTSPTRRVRRAGNAVRLSGRLSSAAGGEHVVVSFREQGSVRWRFQDVVVASNGTFTAVARIRHTAQFVAQWAGDATQRGAGSKVLTVRVG